MNKKNSDINGILLLDKPLGFTSNQAIQKVKRLLNVKKVGHTGTLDPLATGMLPVCIGQATKFSQFILNSDKEYVVKCKIGLKTDTGDLEGRIIKCSDVKIPSYEKLSLILEGFVGEIEQIPPMYSAIKQNGVPLYKLARAGIIVERKKRVVKIDNIVILNIDRINNSLELKIICGKGTYIRTLVEDIAESFSSFAYVQSLRRTYCSPFDNSLFPMLSIDGVEDNIKNISPFILNISTIFNNIKYNKVYLSAGELDKIYHGVRINIDYVDRKIKNKFVSIYNADTNKFIGVGEILSGSLLAPKKLLR